MNITKEKEQVVKLSNKLCDVRIILDTKYPEMDMLTVDSAKKFHIDSTGEYEVGGVCIFAKTHDDEISVASYEILMDDITILYLSKEFKYDKQTYSDVGQVNILIIDVNGSDEYKEVLSKFDPEVLILMGNEEHTEGLLKKMDISNFSKEKTLKFDSLDFEQDDFVLKTYLLN